MAEKSTRSDWTPDQSVAEIRRLIANGLLGLYTRAEVTEIVAFLPGAPRPVNLFTLLVAEEAPTSEAGDGHFLNQSRIRIHGLQGWKFGIHRYTLPVDQLVSTFDRLVSTGIWDASGEELDQQASAARPPQFVPPDFVEKIPWNRVLKNNFWNGSYVVEWGDTEKAKLKPIFTSPHLLQALSEAINEYVPVSLASLSDRLGSIALQLPVTVLMAQFNSGPDGTFVLETGWHPHSVPRPLRATVELEFDKVITGYRSTTVDGERTVLLVPPGPGAHRGFLWDEANGLVMAATGLGAFIHTIAMNLQPVAPEPRVFSLPDENGEWKPQRISVHSTLKSLVGSPENDGNEGWTRRRMYREETLQLVRERRFVQYRPQPGQQSVEHERALNDIRYLIDQYGEEGAWLWDPYLSALDILKTLFFSKNSGADLRGLTAGKETVEQSSGTDFDVYKRLQVDAFKSARSNFRGMKFEFRAKSGSSGWKFHDRFLIFPRKERGALAWSLGTSINSLGKAHHILQRIDDGQQVMDAFVELWDELQGPDHLIWKVPAR